MATLPHVTWLRAFESAARNASFSAAAEELNLTPAAVSQQIKLLEHHLGAQLFIRLPRGVALTDIGHAYAQPVRKSFADMQQATNSLFSSKRRRTVRVHASISYAALVLAPHLWSFHHAFPDIDLQMTTAVWTDRIEDETIDVEIRFGHGDWQDGDIHHLGHRLAEVVCHPALASSLGKTLSLATLYRHAVQIIGSETDWAQMFTIAGEDQPATIGTMKADSSLIALQIIAGSSGAAIVSEEFSRRYVEQGLLVSPLDLRLPLARSFFLVMRETTSQRSEVVAFRDWLLSLQPSASLSG
ncbi:LysR family transcriptional regulator [Roseibium sediminis]|uniref:LysR family transcriptional regulator n=1 Tax=Roseibium sediminis TaxID=1775174 RepID=UPI00123D03DF|nr:LysR family transcriptional regulator [Roseibium sediminis]